MNIFANFTDNPYFESVGDIWLIWALCLIALSLLLWRGLSRFKWPSLREFARDEEGASYALPYVLTFPFVMLLVCLMIQSSLILLVKFGTVYAGYAASRSAIVWRSSDPESDKKGLANAEYYAHRAAMLAMTPFSSGYRDHAERIFAAQLARAISTGEFPFSNSEVHTIALDQLFDLYSDMYFRLAKQHSESSGHSPIIKSPNALAREEYVKNKLIYAGLATEVEFDEKFKNGGVEWNDDVKVTVKHRMHLHIPGAARALSNARGGSFWNPLFFVRDIESTVTLPSEAPRELGKLNVPYDPAFLSRYFNFEA